MIFLKGELGDDEKDREILAAAIRGFVFGGGTYSPSDWAMMSGTERELMIEAREQKDKQDDIRLALALFKPEELINEEDAPDMKRQMLLLQAVEKVASKTQKLGRVGG